MDPNQSEDIPVDNPQQEILPYTDTEQENQLTPEDPSELPFTFNEEAPNLIPEFEAHPEGMSWLKRTVMECSDEFRKSWDKNEGYRQKVAESWRVLYCDLPPKNKPYENCANAAIPLALQNIVRYTNKIYSELFGDWSNVFSFLPTSPKADVIAPIVSEHSNWQINHKIVGFKRQQHRGVLIFAVAGDVVCHSYYDDSTRRNCHEVLTCDDFVTPYTHVSTSSDFSDVPWIARRIPFFKTKLKSMKGIWSNIDKVIAHSAPEYSNGEVSTELRDAISDFLKEDPFGQKSGEYEIIHYEGWLTLPGQDKDRYCQLIFDINTLAPLKLSIHERATYQEKYRFQYQSNEAQQYAMAKQQYEQYMQGKQQQMQMLSQQIMTTPQDSPNIAPMAQQFQQLQSIPDPPPPTPPTWMKIDGQQPEPMAKEPIHMFSHGVCLEPILGNTGIGIGRIDTQLNLATNTVWSQFLDAATLGNGKTFITAGNVDFRSPFKIGPGVFNKAKNVMPSDLQNAFYELDFGQANPQLMQAAESLMGFGEQASSTPDLMSGAPGKSGETARGIQARLEQVNSMIAVPAMKYADFVIQIMKNNCKLNAIYMDEYEIFYTNRFDDNLEMMGADLVKVAREFYDNEFEIELESDMQFKSRSQKVSEADEIVQLPNVMPDLFQMNFAFKYQAIKEALKARGLYRFARKLLGPAPPPPMNTFGLPPGTPGTAMGQPMMPQQGPPGQPGQPPPGQPPQGGPPPQGNK